MNVTLRQEPRGHLIFLHDDSDDSVVIADCISPLMAAHIVDCVNACAVVGRNTGTPTAEGAITRVTM